MAENINEMDILELEIQRRKLFEPLRFFKPNGAEERFIDAIADPESKIILFPAGNWVGKTAAAIVSLGACIFPNQAEHPCFNKPIFKDWSSFGFPKRARIVSTPKELEEIGSVQVEIKKWFPRGRYSAEKVGKTYPSLFKANEWTIDTMTYEQSIEEFEGATIGFFIFNEPSPEEIFNACLARMKFGGKVLMSITPLMGSAWIFDKLISQEGKNGIRVIYGDTEDNCVEHGKNGVLPHSAIQSLADSCDPDEKEARLHGKFMVLSGNIFKTFDRNLHVAKEPIVPPPIADIEHIMSVDPATGKPIFALWGYIDMSGNLYIYDEYPNFDFASAKESKLTISDYIKIFKDKEKYIVRTRILDRHFGNNRSWTGTSLKQDFNTLGFFFFDSYSCDEEVETGIMKIKEYLAYNKTQPLSNINKPSILISPVCINLIKSMERWGRNPKTGKPNDDCWKDPCDCLRYICAYRPLPVQISSIQGLKEQFNRNKPSRNWDTSRPFDD